MSRLGDMFKEFAKESVPKKPPEPPKKVVKEYIDVDLREKYKGVDFDRIKDSTYFQRLVTYILKVAFDESFKNISMKESKEVMKKKLDKNVDKINICQQAVINEMKLNPMFLKHRID